MLNGKEGNRFDPAGPLTRAQTAAILYRYLNRNQAAAPAEGGDGSKVYMITDISPEGLMAVYKALNWTPTGKVAVKLSTGEPPASNYLRPELIKDVVQEVGGTIVECNTAYGGSRSSTAMHYQVAKDHGFTDIADVVILDENGSMSLPVNGGTNLKENLVGQHFGEYDSYLVLSHFKGHAMAGYGGAIKNISIGLGSQEGKCLIHTGGKSNTSPWGGDQTAFTESMAEAGKSVSDYLGNGERIVYVNVMNRLSIDCDCDGNPSERWIRRASTWCMPRRMGTVPPWSTASSPGTASTPWNTRRRLGLGAGVIGSFILTVEIALPLKSKNKQPCQIRTNCYRSD